MFLLSLEVENFKVLRKARLTFGRGLNVLYGPNDIGKSSLAEALRVAFLLSTTSNKWHDLVPWGTDDVPRVVLKFEMNGEVWQITKTFGSGARGTSLLHRIGESGSLREEKKGPGVEAKLREIIAWGIPAPGEKGAPKGLPENYLSTALLGWQDKVTAILEAKPGPVNSGLELVTRALGAIGQDPKVSQLLQRLQELTERVFTERGELRRAEDSPLVQRNKKLKDQEDHLHNLEESLRQSVEIEKKVQCLTEQHSRLERRVELLDRVRKAEEELERVRSCEQAIAEARDVLAGVEEDLRKKESSHKQATVALSNVQKALRTAGERLAKSSGLREKIQENVQQAREARRAEIIGQRDAAARQVQAAQAVIQARRQVERCELGSTTAEEAHEQAQHAELRAQNLAKLARVLEEQRRAKVLVEALSRVTEAEKELEKAKGALHDAEDAAKSRADASATAEQRESRKETLRTSLIRAETAEQKAVQDANAVTASAARLVAAEKSLGELATEERAVESSLAENAAQKQACEARLMASMPLPIQAALLLGLFGAAIAAALGIGLRLPGGILAMAIAGSGLFAAGAVFVFKHRKMRGPIKLLQREYDDLVKGRENFLERRNHVSMKRGAAQARADEARAARDQAMATVGDLSVATAGSRLQQARHERERIRRELATLEALQIAMPQTHVENAGPAIARLKEEDTEKRRMLDEARQHHIAAQVRYEEATCPAASVDLARLEKQVHDARMEAHGEAAPDPEEALTRLELARGTTAERELVMKIAKGRLSDARSNFEEMARSLGQPADQLLAEAEKKREDAANALEGIEETFAAEVTAAENELLDAHADVEGRSKEQATAHAEAEAATQARDDARTKREQARANFEALLPSVPNANSTDAETALLLARKELESDPNGSTSPEDLAAVGALLEQKQVAFRRTENELLEARGQLKFVGGAVARDQRDQEFEALDALKKSAEDLEHEYRATKYLLDVLKEEETKHAAHLGRSLAKPVTEIFSEFTARRYAEIVLHPDLRFKGVMAKGGEKELGSLSVGTRDQLATLVRLALAAHLKCVVVLDDQLAQSDPDRIARFRERLRTSVREHGHQIIVLTCRPLDYLHGDEMPVPPCDWLKAEDGMLAVVDLERRTLRG